MSIHSISILASTKQYVNLPTELLTKIRQLFGTHLAMAWEVFYMESRRTHGVITKTYDYLARKMGCSRKTVIRYVKRLKNAGILIVNKRFHYNCPLENEYILLTPDEALLAAKASNDRLVPIDIDYSVDLSSEQHNSVDNSGTFCPLSITVLNTDINTTEAAPIAALRPEDEHKEMINLVHDISDMHTRSRFPVHETPKSVSSSVINRIEKIVKGIPGVSSPSELVREAIHFVANRKEGYGEWRAVGAFAKLLGKGGNGPWRKPFSMRYEK